MTEMLLSDKSRTPDRFTWPKGPYSFQVARLLPGVGISKTRSQNPTCSYQADRIKSMKNLGTISWVVSGSIRTRAELRECPEEALLF